MSETKRKTSNDNSQIEEDKIPFHSLSPISDPESHKHYCDALEWALINRKEQDIKNIALTGDYGSGKSSILKTFKERKIEGLNFLDISLATFKEERKNKLEGNLIEGASLSNDNKKQNKNKGDDRNNQLRLIELSILQQIFYHEKIESIPDSRFKKIRSLKPSEIKNATWLVFGLLCSFFLFFFFDKFRILLNVPEPLLWFEYVVKGLVLTSFLILFFYFLKKVIQFSQRLTISKLNFQNLEIQISDTLNKSILNNHLDEILYFFEVTNYNVVIIEDLDRFEQTEIFTKLREINLLINNSESIDREVVFIYAVRDEMFKENDRTKFFDFIIPIIPVINYSNSNEQLTKALNKFGYNISTDLIDEVAFYVDDMRLLYNIVNEFHIYFLKFQGKEFVDKLFAMIVYKNIYPEDFVKLGRNKGMIYKHLVKNKSSWIKQVIDEIEKENLELKRELDQLEKTLPKNLNELKRIYLLEYLNKAPYFTSFRIGNSSYTIDNMLDDENFEKLINNKVTYHSHQYGHNQPFGLQFSQAEAQVDTEQGYLDRKVEIEQKSRGRMKAIRDKLKSNEEKILNTRAEKIKYLLKSKKIPASPNPTKQEQLITLLIRNGYIAEDYLNYISYFYPGSITERDHWFLMNVRNEAPSDFEYKLDEVGNVIKKIGFAEFEKNYVLNYSIVDYLFEHRTYTDKKNLLIKQLSNESDVSVKFVKSYIKKSKNARIFIKELCEYWSNIWVYIDQDVSLAEGEKLNFYTLILCNTEVTDMQKMAYNSSMESFIADNPGVLALIEDEEKFVEIVDLFDIKFNSLIFDGISEKIKNYVYENNNYALSLHNIQILLGQRDNSSSLYTDIINSDKEHLKKYVDSEIDNFVKTILLRNNDQIKESVHAFESLLNHPTLNLELKYKIIEHQDGLIHELEKINDVEIQNYLLYNLKVDPIWENVLTYIKNLGEEEYDDSLITFLNENSIYNQLEKHELDSSLTATEDELKKYSMLIIHLTELNLDSFKSLINSLTYKDIELDFSKLTEEKVAWTIKTKFLTFDESNFNSIANTFPELLIQLVEQYQDEFLNNYDKLDIEESLIEECLNSNSFKNKNKLELLKIIDNEYIMQNRKISSIACDIFANSTYYPLEIDLLEKMFLNNFKWESKIKLLLLNFHYLKSEDIISLTNKLTLDKQYSKLFELRKRTLFERNEFNESLFQKLIKRGLIKSFDIYLKDNNKFRVISNYE